jgi:amphiphysin
VDYDRHSNSLAKLRDKKEKSLNDEKNLFKVSRSASPLLRRHHISSQLEQDFDLASREFDAINTAMKTDLPRFMTLATSYIDPLFHSFYYMQSVNYFYFLVQS